MSNPVERPPRPDVPDVAAARVFGEHGSVVLANATSYSSAESTSSGPHAAVEAGVIERGRDILMARHGWSSQQAFDTLCREAQWSGRTLGEVAQGVLASLAWPPRPRALRTPRP